MAFCSVNYLYRGYKREHSKEKLLMYGFASFFVGATLQRIFFFISDYHIEGSYLGHSYYGESLTNLSPTFEILLLYGTISLFSGLALFYFTFEKLVKSTRYFLTFLTLIFIFITIFIDYSLNYYFFFGSMMITISILIWLSIKSTEEFQTVSALMLIGFGLFWLELVANSRVLRQILNLSPALAPFITIIGLLIVLSPEYINPEILSKSRPFIPWLSLIIGCGIWLIFSLYFLFNPLLPFIFFIANLIGIFPLTSMIIYSIIQIIKILKGEEDIKGFIIDKVKKGKFQDFLSMFTKPKKITEDEVTFYREQKICLVCKGKVGGFNFICSKCDALYCEKCAQALITLENACWVCESAIDESKPVKILKEKEEEVELKKGFPKRLKQ